MLIYQLANILALHMKAIFISHTIIMTLLSIIFLIVPQLLLFNVQKENLPYINMLFITYFSQSIISGFLISLSVHRHTTQMGLGVLCFFHFTMLIAAINIYMAHHTIVIYPIIHAFFLINMVILLLKKYR